MLNVKSLEDVSKIIKEHFHTIPIEKEIAGLDDLTGRITAEEIVSKEDIPGFNRSMVDGYAVKAVDTNGASDTLPVQLECIGSVKMGVKPDFKIKKGQAAYIPTGGEIPDGADAVVMVEYTEDLDDGFIYINKSAASGSNMVFIGDDTAAGKTVIKSNHRLNPQDVGAIAAMGYTKAAVKRRLRLGIISTGDELVDVSGQISGSKVRDVNSHLLYSAAIISGTAPKSYGIVNDDFSELKKNAEKALSECDIVLISGGSSAGQQDQTYEIIKSLNNSKMLLHGIAVKPGKPTILAEAGGKAVVGLPGHPVSAYFIYILVVKNIIDVMYGLDCEIKSYAQAEMATNYPSNNGREEYLPVILKNEGARNIAYPLFGKSGLITLLTNANGYIRISRGSEGLKKGQIVDVTLLL